MTRPQRPSILWDVVQEHLDEAVFFWVQRERSLRAPDHVLSEVAEGDEWRLLAHLSGLRTGGPEVAERLLLPALEEEGFVLCVAAHALLVADPRRWGPVVLRRFEGCTLEQEPYLRQALSLAPGMEVDQLLREALPRLSPALQVSALDILRFRQVDVGAVLEQLSTTESPMLLAAAARAARFASGLVAEALVTRALDFADARCQEAGIETGLVRGLPAAAALCRRLSAAERPGRIVLAALAASGDRRGTVCLLDAVEDPSRRAEALWALGFSGRVEAAEAALRLVLQAQDALAADTFRLITGLQPEVVWGPSQEDEEAEASEPPPDVASCLPGPAVLRRRVRAEAVDQWWRRARERFPAGVRYLLGRPWTPEAALAALQESPMPRRPALAWELAVRSGGACRVETETWTWQQARQMRVARDLRWAVGSRPFELILGAR